MNPAPDEYNRKLRQQLEQEWAEVQSMKARMTAAPATVDWFPEARVLAAQCWCDPETSSIEMDVRLAEACARRIAAWMETGAFHAKNEAYWRERAERAEQDAARLRDLLSSLDLQISRGQIAQAREDIAAALKEGK